jgi:hypothetical protein
MEATAKPYQQECAIGISIGIAIAVGHRLYANTAMI